MAEPIPFPEYNRVLGAPKGAEGILDLPIWTDGIRCVSKWSLTLPELAEIQRTGHIWLHVWFGDGTQPPVSVSSENPFHTYSYLTQYPLIDDGDRCFSYMVSDAHGFVQVDSNRQREPYCEFCGNKGPLKPNTVVYGYNSDPSDCCICQHCVKRIYMAMQAQGAYDGTR